MKNYSRGFLFSKHAAVAVRTFVRVAAARNARNVTCY